MTKTQFNFALPADLLSFTSSKVDNSASTDANMPATKSPDFYYEGTKADGSVQNVSLYYDTMDSYKKKLLVDGITTDLDGAGADDAVTDISLEGSFNPTAFLFRTMDGNVGYIYNAVDTTMVAIQDCSSGSCTETITDSYGFENIYNNLTNLPAPAPLKIIFSTPNPLTGDDKPVKSFVFNMDTKEGYVLYTFIRDDSSSFTMTLEDAEIPVTQDGVTLTKLLTINDNGSTKVYNVSANMYMELTQLSGFSYNGNGTYTAGEPNPIEIEGTANLSYDGFRVIIITSLQEIDIGGNTIYTNAADSGVVITSDMTMRGAIVKHMRRLKAITHKATTRFLNPLRNLGKKMGKK